MTKRRVRSVMLLLACAAGCSRPPEQAAPAVPAPTPPEQSLAPATPGDAERIAREMDLGRARPEDLKLSMRRIHFSFDSNALSDESQDALRKAAEQLARYPEVGLEVEGHADERGTVEHNLALGQRRAEAVVGYLVTLGIAPQRLAAVSYGAERPLRQGSDQLSWATNRRVDFRLVSGAAQLVVEDGTPVDDRGRSLTGRPGLARAG